MQSPFYIRPGTPYVRGAPERNVVKVFLVVCEVLLIITSTLLVLSTLFYEGKGGDISEMFDGDISTSMRSSEVVERNLNRITVDVALIWGMMTVLIGLIMKFGL